MPARAHAAIRSVLASSPDTEVRYIESLTVDTFFHREDRVGSVLFVSPVHRRFVADLRGT